MKEHLLESVCTIRSDNSHWDSQECVIVGPLQHRTAKDAVTDKDVKTYAYLVKLAEDGDVVCCTHGALQLKKFPPAIDAWCATKMAWTLEPLRGEIE